VARWRGGAVLVGRTVSQLAFPACGHQLHYGTPGIRPMRTPAPGGSSSGAAVSVATVALVCLFPDTRQKPLRIPASQCNLSVVTVCLNLRFNYPSVQQLWTVERLTGSGYAVHVYDSQRDRCS
jgi:hypothetical protein